MVNNCAIRTCKEKYSANIMMHRYKHCFFVFRRVGFALNSKIVVVCRSIPKSVDMRDKWLKAIRQHAPDFKPTAHSKICSLHFKKSDYTLSVVSYRKMLRKGAIPSIFTAARKFVFQFSFRSYSLDPFRVLIYFRSARIVFELQGNRLWPYLLSTSVWNSCRHQVRTLHVFSNGSFCKCKTYVILSPFFFFFF